MLISIISDVAVALPGQFKVNYIEFHHFSISSIIRANIYVTLLIIYFQNYVYIFLDCQDSISDNQAQKEQYEPRFSPILLNTLSNRHGRHKALTLQLVLRPYGQGNKIMLTVHPKITLQLPTMPIFTPLRMLLPIM